MRILAAPACAAFLAFLFVAACTGGGSDVGDAASGTSSSSSSGGSSSSSSGASSSSSGFVTDGGPGDCLGAVAFELTSNSTTTCVGADCSSQFVSVLRADRSPLVTFNECSPSCGACQSVGCPGSCAQPVPVPAGGAKSGWSGKIFEQLHCTVGADGPTMSCLEPRCAPAGKYVAKFCAFKGTEGSSTCSTGSSAQTCTEVEFDYPTTAPVKATLF